MTKGLAKTPWWFWLITSIYLIWSAFACYHYWLEMSLPQDAYIKAFGEEAAAIRGLAPWWSVSSYAIGVWGGLVGVLVLILRRKWCLPFFYASLAGAVIGWSWNILDIRFRTLMGAGSWALMIFIWLECIFIIWFAHTLLRKGVIK